VAEPSAESPEAPLSQERDTQNAEGAWQDTAQETFRQRRRGFVLKWPFERFQWHRHDPKRFGSPGTCIESRMSWKRKNTGNTT